MSIKAGAIIHDANGFVIDRIQSAGPGTLNIPEEKSMSLVTGRPLLLFVIFLTSASTLSRSTLVANLRQCFLVLIRPH